MYSYTPAKQYYNSGYKPAYNQYTRRPYYRRSYNNNNNYNNQSRLDVYKSAGSQLYKDVSMLKNLINVEFKSNEVTLADVAATNTGIIQLLNGLQKGDNINSREGRVVRWKSVQCLMKITMDSGVSASIFRCLIVIDKQPNQTTLTMSQLLGASTVTSLKNLDNRKRFVILKDELITLSSDKPEAMINYYRKIDMKTIYDASDSGNIADISTNAIYCVFLSDQTAALEPLVDATFRLRFIDN